VSTKAGRQSTLGYTHGSSLSVDTCASYELDGDARHRQGFYPRSAAVWAQYLRPMSDVLLCVGSNCVELSKGGPLPLFI